MWELQGIRRPTGHKVTGTYRPGRRSALVSGRPTDDGYSRGGLRLGKTKLKVYAQLRAWAAIVLLRFRVAKGCLLF